MKSLKAKHIELNDQETKICVPITGRTVDEIKKQAMQVKRMKPDIVEWRADYLKEKISDISTNRQVLKVLKESLGNIPVIYTIRTQAEGGEWDVDDETYKRICIEVSEIASEFQVDFVDVEVCRLSDAKDYIDRIHQYPVQVIGSNHHFFSTPDVNEMIEVLRKIDETGADICKLAVMPKTNDDVKSLIEASEKVNEMIKKPLITMSMSERGTVTRVCTAKTGSVISFAAGVNASAPGQADVETVKSLLQINRGCKLWGNIILIGFMGTGKTTISRALSLITGLQEIDVDKYIVETEGVSINEIFEQKGEQGFRDIETEALRKITQSEGQIISCGGGAVLRDENVEILKKSGQIVLLKATPETVYNRVKNDTHRPILNKNMSVEYIEELMKQREPRYISVTDLQVSVDCNDRVKVCNEILKELKKRDVLITGK